MDPKEIQCGSQAAGLVKAYDVHKAPCCPWPCISKSDVEAYRALETGAGELDRGGRASVHSKRHQLDKAPTVI